MVNPIDKTFFSFFFAFASILLVSFVILYVVGQFNENSEVEAAAAYDAYYSVRVK